MDFGLREWLFIIGLLVIAGILFDGWRRMGGRSKIRFKLERNLADLPEEGNDELLGPPRVVNRQERAEPSFGDSGPSAAPTGDEKWHELEQVGLDILRRCSSLPHQHGGRACATRCIARSAQQVDTEF